MSRLYTGPAVVHYVTRGGVVFAATLPLPKYHATALHGQGARLLRRAERRRLVSIDEWRAGKRAPERVPT